MINGLLSDADRKLDRFIITQLEKEHNTKLRYAEYKRLTMTSEIFGACKTDGCEGYHFTRLAALYNKAGCDLRCEGCRMGTGSYKSQQPKWQGK